MTQREKDIIRLMIKLSLYGAVVGTVVSISIPVALWAIPKWPQRPFIPALIFTAVGGAASTSLKEVLISRAERKEPLKSELAPPV